VSRAPAPRGPSRAFRVGFVGLGAGVVLSLLLLPGSPGALLALACFAAGTALTAVAVLSPGSGLLGEVVTRGDARRPRVALTWDDGPDPRVTPALLDLLAARGVRGTFFLVGERAAAHPELVRRLAAEGHEPGNHSWGHGLLTNLLSTRRLAGQLARTQAELARHGEPPRHYRPPFGLLSHAVAPACAATGLRPVCWSVRSWDTLRRPAADVADTVLRRVHPGAVVLLHDGGRDPARVLETARLILDGLDARGLQPVRLDALLAEGPSGP